ncbi:hypothetical protein, partial [Actinacidiphila soli]|uniref:hypothetical protein n=1 Tax=Actinacidiphila soli TaxID=2487275 RepID=UPI0019D0BB8D
MIIPLFGAIQDGMSPDMVAKRTGRTKAAVEQAATAVKTVGAATRAALAQADGYEWTTDVLAVLGEFDDDPAAVERLITARTAGYFAHQVTRERDDRTKAQARDARRAELAAAGVTLIEDADDLPDTSGLLAELRGADGDEIDSVDHASCPGHVAIWAEYNEVAPAAVMFLCTDPEAHGHALKEDDAPQEEPDQASTDAGQSAAPVKPEKEEGMPYNLKVEGNAAYRAAGKTPRQWLR